MTPDASTPLDRIVNHISESIVLIDRERLIVFYNTAFKTYENLTPQPAYKCRLVYDIVSTENRDLVKLCVERVFDGGGVQTIELTTSSSTNERFFFDLTFQPIQDADQKVQYVCIVCRDVTVQKALERRNSQLSEQLTTLIERANAIIFGTDAQGYITDWNNQSSIVTKLVKDDVLGRKFHSLFSERAAPLYDLLDRVLKGEFISNFECVFQMDNAESVILLLNGTPKISPKGKVVGGLFIGQDVTELSRYRASLERQVTERTKALKEALAKEREVVEMKNRLVSIASHEFKIPLNAIHAAVEALKRKLPLAQQSSLETIDRQVSGMKVLLEDVLHVQKHENKKLRPNMVELNLTRVVQSLIAEVRDATNQTHQFLTTFPDRDVVMRSDEKLLRNVFLNLFSNAVKFSPGQDAVAVDMRMAGKNVVISVEDKGIGIDPNEIDKVFEPFTRGSNSGMIKGTGLGLSIVKRAVEALGGDISVKSLLGVGTTFLVTLPLEYPDHASDGG